MDELMRLASDQNQLTKRVDDMSLRLAIAEKEIIRFDEKISDIKVLIVEKHNDLRNDFTASQTALETVIRLNQTGMQKSIDAWNRVGWWIVSVVGSAIILAVLGLVLIK